MASEAPPFWWKPVDWRARALGPAAAIYGAVAARRMSRKDAPGADAPVLCVGNLTVGGTGKTPVAIAMTAAARAAGFNPGVVSRGHGGRQRKAHLVDLEHDTAADVGDEPLLLARHAPVAVSPKRIDAAQMLVRYGCDFLIMDDGFQSARLAYDYALLLIDARHGVGNGRVIPAGPVRAPIGAQLRRADAIVRMGEGNAAERMVRYAARAAKPVFNAAACPVDAGWVAGQRLLAFSGIGHPRRFYDSLKQQGGEVVEARSFPDHHVFTREQLQELDAEARKQGLRLVTTEKDYVRLTASLLPKGFLERLLVLKIAARFEEPGVPARIIQDTADAYQRRKFGAASG